MLKGWKTRIFNWLVMALSLLASLNPQLVADALGYDAQGAAIIALTLSTINAGLREITNGPAGGGK